MMQTWENDKNPNSGPNFVPQNVFSWNSAILDVTHCCKLSLYTISRETNKPNLRK